MADLTDDQLDAIEADYGMETLRPLDVRALVAEVRRLRAALDRAHDLRIEAQNPGIDMRDVRAARASRRHADG